MESSDCVPENAEEHDTYKQIEQCLKVPHDFSLVASAKCEFECRKLKQIDWPLSSQTLTSQVHGPRFALVNLYLIKAIPLTTGTC
nr:hypothetical transcript [Hymenolepis microstoma]